MQSTTQEDEHAGTGAYPAHASVFACSRASPHTQTVGRKEVQAHMLKLSIHTYTDINTYKCTHTQPRIHAHTHIHTYTRMHAQHRRDPIIATAGSGAEQLRGKRHHRNGTAHRTPSWGSLYAAETGW